MFYSSFVLILSYLTAAGSVSFLARQLNVFPTVRGFRLYSVCLVSAPIIVAWIYGWLLRIVPDQPSLYYLLFVFCILVPGGILEAIRVARSLKFSMEYNGINKIHNFRSINILSFAAFFLLFIILTIISINKPLIANDPLEYAYVARQIFNHQRLLGIYPLIDERLAGGFYGPWTHPPGFVLMIAWGFVVQGTADVVGIAKLANVYNLIALMILVYAWAGGHVRYRGVVAALLILSSPILLSEAIDMHVDVSRIALWTAQFCLLSEWFLRRSYANTIGLGIVIGLSMFIHSIGLLFWPIFIGMLPLVRGMSLLSRLSQFVVLAVVAGTMIIPDYWQNLVHFGRLIGDSSVPLWEISRFELQEFYDAQRGITTLRGRLNKGIFEPLTGFGLYGYSVFAAAVVGITYGVMVLIVTRLRLPKIIGHMRAPTLKNVLLLSCLGFVAAVVLSVALDMSLIIKNARYLATMIGIYSITAVILGDTILRYVKPLSFRRWHQWRSLWVRWATNLLKWTRNWMRESLVNKRLERVLTVSVYFLACTILAVIATRDIDYQIRVKSALFQKAHPSPERVDGQHVLICSGSSGFKIIGEINNKVLAGEVSGPIKILTFRPSDVAYYAKFPFVSYLDPRLIPAYSASSAINAHLQLVEMGISHLFVPDYAMGEIENTAISLLISDPKLAQLAISRGGYKLFRLKGQPHIFEENFGEPLQAEPRSPLRINVSKFGQFESATTESILLDCTDGFEHTVEDGVPAIAISGSQLIQLSRLIEVDPHKAYRMSFDIRVTGDSGSALTEVGLATFDTDGKLQTDPPGAHRYGVAVGRYISSSKTWTHLEGVFQGIGNDNFNQFRQGTKYVKPIFLLNYRGTDTTTEIRNLRFEIVPD